MPLSYPNESDAYRSARNDLLEAEIALRAQIEAVAAKRRALPPGGELSQDYAFTGTDGRTRTLSSLFGDKSTMALYSYMFAPGAARPCPACTSLLDGLNGQAPQIAQRIAFAVVSSARPEQLAAISKERNWRNILLVSADGTDYQTLYHGRTADGEQPMMNVFRKQEGTVRHFWGSEMLHADLQGHPRHMDLAWPIWGILDMAPEGRGDFFPQVFGS
jgi:predicted dithiol-disulfide oxidoreductase (DUF899 family)